MIETKKATEVKTLGKKDNIKSVASRYLEILKTLQQKFPEAFPVSEVRALKVGIHKDVGDRTDFKSIEIRKFFYKYCNSKRYKAVHTEGANRYDLEGNAVGVVTAEEMAKQQKLSDGNHENRKS